MSKRAKLAEPKDYAKALHLIEDSDIIEISAGSIKGAMKATGSGSQDKWMMHPDQIRIIPNLQPKVPNKSYIAWVEEIAESMLEVGWLINSAIAGYAGLDPETGESVIYVTDGHSRLLALEIANKKGAGIDLVPVLVQAKGVSMDDININLVRGNGGRALTPYEKGVVCKRLLKSGYSEADVQRQTGVKDPWFSKLMRLMAAPHKLKELVAFEAITATLAIEMIEDCNGNATKALEKIEKAIADKAPAADADGVEPKTPVKITKKDINDPVAKFGKAVKKSAVLMHTALERVQSDPGFNKLTPETRETLMALLAELAKAKPDAVAEPDSQAALFADGETKAA